MDFSFWIATVELFSFHYSMNFIEKEIILFVAMKHIDSNVRAKNT